MKNKLIILTAFLLQISLGSYAQYVNNEWNGIHVNGGYSTAHNDTISSNIGTGCYAIGVNSFAGGEQSVATGNCSFAFGYHSLAIPNQSGVSIALGRVCQAKEIGSYAIGDNVMATGTFTLGLGFNIKTANNNSIVIGSGNSIYDTLIGAASGITMGMGSIYPTLFVSKANLLGTGKVAIGNVPVSDIAAKLHIRSDSGEDASILLQPNNNERAYIWFSDKYHELGVNGDGSMNLISVNNAFRLESNNVSIFNGEFALGSHNEKPIRLTTTGFPALYVNSYRIGNSYFGSTPGACFAIEFTGDTMSFRSSYASNIPRSLHINNWQDLMLLKANGSIVMNGKVGVNVENSTADYALAVDGGIITTKVYIQDVQNWPDYVFGDTYRLMPLHELKTFIQDNRHLPEMPPGSEIEGQGYDMQEMQRAMMKKIEELTLYTLQQQEEIEMLRKTVEELEKGK